MRTRKILSVAEALARAAALCDKCEQCSPDIIKKLTAWGISADDTEKIIRKLKDTRYLDDMRFAHAYAHDKMAYSGWGRQKIIQGLWAKRLGREYIDAACSELDPTEYKRVAVKVIKSKVRSLEGGLSTYENRVKALKFGVQRGFSVKLVSSIIDALYKLQRDKTNLTDESAG
ncbi:MAG: RecX family transcriptional regulator [Muribaculaceae bacterium]|nr:RecX family transcriptional regulator [Muribaculaceae bacterium]